MSAADHDSHAGHSHATPNPNADKRPLSIALGLIVAVSTLKLAVATAEPTRRRHHPVPQHGAQVVNLVLARLTGVALWRKCDTLPRWR